MDTYRACSIIEGFSGEEHTWEERLEAWQYLVDTGIVWKLQGFYGRHAAYLIEEGLIVRKGYVKVTCPVCEGTATFEIREWQEADKNVTCDECGEGGYVEEEGSK
jgi:ribosomal protein S27E